MPVERLSVRKIKEVLRLRFETKRSFREIGQSISASPATVQGYVARAEAAGLSWPLPPEVEDTALETRLFPSVVVGASRVLAVPDFDYLHREMKRKHVTLHLLWQEYKANHPADGYQYSQFCELYRKHTGTLDVVLRQDYRAGERMDVDFLRIPGQSDH